MNSQTLREARKYEEASEKMIPADHRPSFHLSVRTGWMNDPNGFSYYKGRYHMFYQYYPYDSHWNSMHWGHAVSDDLLHWEYLPAALAPDESYDRDGCFSGNAMTLPDGRQLLMYTGVVQERQKNEAVVDWQNQCIAVGDGVDYEKYENNPVIDAKDLPEGFSRQDFRDPKLWRKSDGTYRCIVGNRPADGSGQILLFSSPDCFSWKYEKVFAANNNRFGLMWECPDFFELDGSAVLLVSPQDMLPEGFEYHNGNGTLCLIGDYDEKTDTFTERYNQSVDYGIDFYAPQTVLTPDGRLYQTPIRELDQLRRNRVDYQNVLVSEQIHLEGIRGRRVDMELAIRPEDGQEVYHEFILNFAQNDKYHTTLSFHTRNSILKIDRKFSGSRRAIIHQRRSLVNSKNGALKLRVILDRFSAEIFVNDGEQVMTATIYTEQEADGISFSADGAVRMDITRYELAD